MKLQTFVAGQFLFNSKSFMKKLEKIINSNAFGDHPEFQNLLSRLVTAKADFKLAREVFHQKRDEHITENKKKHAESDLVFRLKSAAQIASHKKAILEIEVREALFELKSWISTHNKKGKTAGEEKTKKSKTAINATPEKVKAPKNGKTPTAAKAPQLKTTRSKSSSAEPGQEKKGHAKLDDLKSIEGIGPAIEKLLHQADIRTFSKLAAMKAGKLSEILLENGSRYKMYDPASWPEQAKLAAKGQFDELKIWQANHKNGRLN